MMSISRYVTLTGIDDVSPDIGYFTTFGHLCLLVNIFGGVHVLSLWSPQESFNLVFESCCRSLRDQNKGNPNPRRHAVWFLSTHIPALPKLISWLHHEVCCVSIRGLDTNDRSHQDLSRKGKQEQEVDQAQIILISLPKSQPWLAKSDITMQIICNLMLVRRL